MISQETIDNLRSQCEGRVHCVLQRATFCTLVRDSGTDDEGLVKSEAFLRQAVEIDECTTLASNVVRMLDLLEHKTPNDRDDV